MIAIVSIISSAFYFQALIFTRIVHARISVTATVLIQQVYSKDARSRNLSSLRAYVS